MASQIFGLRNSNGVMRSAWIEWVEVINGTMSHFGKISTFNQLEKEVTELATTMDGISIATIYKTAMEIAEHFKILP